MEYVDILCSVVSPNDLVGFLVDKTKEEFNLFFNHAEQVNKLMVSGIVFPDISQSINQIIEFSKDNHLNEMIVLESFFSQADRSVVAMQGGMDYAGYVECFQRECMPVVESLPASRSDREDWCDRAYRECGKNVGWVFGL